MHVSKTSVLALGVLTAIVIAVVVAVVLLLRDRQARKWVLGIFLVGVVIVMVSVVLVRVFTYRETVTVVEYRSDGINRHTATISEMERVFEGGPWSSQAGKTFLADLYPSEAAAAEGVARHLVSTLTTTPGRGGDRFRVRLSGTAGPVALARAADALREMAAVAEIERINVPEGEILSRADPSAVLVRIQIDRLEMGHPRHRQLAVQAALRAGTVATSKTVNYVEKPWVDDFGVFAARDPRKNWIVAASDRACTSQSEAWNRALEIASARVSEAVDSETVRPNRPLLESGGQNRLRSRVRADLHNGNLVTDRFIQRFRRPYGDVWQQWVLVDASPAKLRRVVRGARADVRAWRETWFWRVGSLMGVVCVVFVVYLFLNAATKGYYVWSLRLMALLLGVVLVGVLLLLA